MTTNYIVGFTFGALSLILHFFLLFNDTRRSYVYYNISLFLWVTGNYIWMTIEFVATNPSSGVHVGPHVPIGGMSDDTVSFLINTKTILFLISSTIQIFMYIGIFCNYIKVPEEEDEDVISKNEAFLFCYGNKSYELAQTNNNRANNNISLDLDDLSDINFNSMQLLPVQNTLTLAVIENAYIIFWISKDLFWSWGTGDLTKGKDLAIMYESFAMCFGLLSIFIYVLTSYLYRRNLLRLLDSITTIFWISANYIWMCGEFFLRYDNLTYDDANEGNDTSTRIASAICFSLGLTLQAIIVGIIIWQRRKHDLLERRPRTGSDEYTTVHGMLSGVEMTTHVVSVQPSEGDALEGNQEKGKKKKFKYEHLLESFAPKKQAKEKNTNDFIDEEELVLF
jgi:hypothetical protein